MRLLPSPIRQEQDHRARHLPAPAHPGMHLLDIGCGNGEFLNNARSAGWNVRGIEPDNLASSLCLDSGLEVHRSEEHTSELKSLMRNSYAVFCLKKKKKKM